MWQTGRFTMHSHSVLYSRNDAGVSFIMPFISWKVGQPRLPNSLKIYGAAFLAFLWGKKLEIWGTRIPSGTFETYSPPTGRDPISPPFTKLSNVSAVNVRIQKMTPVLITNAGLFCMRSREIKAKMVGSTNPTRQRKNSNISWSHVQDVEKHDIIEIEIE